MRAVLTRHPLCIVDVGGAMGPDERWIALGPGLCRFVTFEPDDRSYAELAIDPAGRNASLSVGLSDTTGEKTLYLTQGPFASSLYRPNAAALMDFATWPWHQPAGETTIPVDTLDHALASHDAWRPDFIKIDVEGADLDVLKGAIGCLSDVFGLQVEVAFIERNIGAPLQPEIDGWLRGQGFIPHQLIREHWVRNNGLFGATSRPQLIWADALYLRDRDWVMGRMATMTTAEDKEALLAKMTTALLVYGAHDYALELVQAAVSVGHLDAAATAGFRAAVTGSVVSTPWYVCRGAVALLLALSIGLVLCLFGGRGRAVARSITARQAAPLFHALYRSAMRGGLQNSCVSDLQ